MQFLIIFAFILHFGCDSLTWKQNTTATTKINTFTVINQQILTPKCVNCHRGFSSYDEVKKLVSVGSPETSTLYRVVQSGRMPQGGSRLSDTENKQIYNWIKGGALND